MTTSAVVRGSAKYPIAPALGKRGVEARHQGADARVVERLRRATSGLAVPQGESSLLENILSGLVRLVPADGASVLLHQGSRVRVAATRGRVDARAQRGKEYRVDEQPLYKEMQRLGRPVASSELVSPQTSRSSSARMATYLLAPLATPGQFLGALKLVGDTVFDESDAILVQAFADFAAVAIDNSRLTHCAGLARTRSRELAMAAVSAHERDRELLSRELHDDAGQALTALKMQLELLRRDYPGNASTLEEGLGEAADLAGQTLENIRLLSHDLRPPVLSNAGIGGGLRKLCREFSKRIQLVIDYAGSDPTQLPEGAGICLFRVLQESLTNVAKHANASRVHVRLRQDDQGVRLAIEDDGRGFDVRSILGDGEGSTGIGLRSMRERMECLGGELQIHSDPDWGTIVIAELPTEDGRVP